MQLRQLRQVCSERQKSGESLQSIGKSLGVTKGMVSLIIGGYKPGPKTAAVLRIDPSAKVLRDRARRAERKAELERLREENKWLRETLDTVCMRYGVRFEYRAVTISTSKTAAKL